jgi:large subunit ribosomal protein L3
MSEENTQQPEESAEETQQAAPASDSVELNGLYLFKVGMSAIYNEDGKQIPVTVLKYEPWVVSQVKSKDKDGYEAVQIACRPKKATRTGGAEKGHLKAAGFENGAQFIKEVRQALPEGVEVGKKVSLDSLKKGDKVRMTSTSKGRGFAGGMKRWDFGGGPASHGSGFHRRPGSIGNRTWPGRVLPGKRMAGHFGVETITMKNVEVVEVIPEENVLMVKGGVPGARNTLVEMVKQ